MAAHYARRLVRHAASPRAGGGAILFDEFCDWAIARKLTLDDGAELLPAGAAPLPPRPQAMAQRPRPPPVQTAALTRPSSAYAGALKSPRPTSARAAPGQIGWRGGGSSDRAKTSQADEAELARRRQALDAVAAAAAEGFARAPMVAPQPASPAEIEAARRQQALRALDAAAKRGVQGAMTLDEKMERVWSANQRKISPATHMISAPPARHVPTDRDVRMGAPSDPALAAKGRGEAPPPGSENAEHRMQFGNSKQRVRHPYATYAPRASSASPLLSTPSPYTSAKWCAQVPVVSRDELAKDRRTWRCQRCFTTNRPASTSCVSCAQQRAAPLSANAKVHVKPAGWTNV